MTALVKDVIPGWVLLKGKIRRQFEFGNFPAAIRFVNQVARLAEKADHHPDIDIRYKKVRLTLTTHSAGGLTTKDFKLARQINQITR